MHHIGCIKPGRMADAKRVSCPKCDKPFRDNHALKVHERRKTPCVAVAKDTKSKDAMRCPDCGQEFSRKFTLVRHMANSCKKARGATLTPQNPAPLPVAETSVEILESPARAKFDQGESKTSALRYELKATNADPQPDDSEQESVDQALLVNIFGSEDTTHITRRDVDQLIMRVGPVREKNVAEVVKQLMIQMGMKIYSDINHPENITCYTTSTSRNPMVHVHYESGWELVPPEVPMSAMPNRSCNELFLKQPFLGESDGKECCRPEDAELILRHLRANEDEIVKDVGRAFQQILYRNGTLLGKVKPRADRVKD